MKKAGRIDSLQTVRALAFIGIFLSHCGYSILARLGPMGVSFFIILSGFLMTLSYYGTDRIQKVSVKDNLLYACNKLKKLYPLHIVMMVAVLPLLIWENVHNPEHLFAIKTVIKAGIDALLLQSFFPTEGVYYSWNGVAWYLSVCAFLYFVFPWVLRRFKKDKTEKEFIKDGLLLFALQVVLSVGFSGGLKLVHIGNNKLVTWFTYIFPVMRLIDFVIGCKLGLVYKKRIEKMSEANEDKGFYTTLEICAIAILCFCVFLCGNKVISEVGLNKSALWTIPVCLTIYLFAVNKGMLSQVLTCKWLLYIAEISPFAFLIHQVVIRYFHTAIYYTVGGEHMTFPLVPVVCFVITIILSSLWKRKMGK